MLDNSIAKKTIQQFADEILQEVDKFPQFSNDNDFLTKGVCCHVDELAWNDIEDNDNAVLYEFSILMIRIEYLSCFISIMTLPKMVENTLH